MGPAAQIQSLILAQCYIVNAACGTPPEITTLFQLFYKKAPSYTVLHPHAQSSISWSSSLKLPIKASETWPVKHDGPVQQYLT